MITARIKGTELDIVIDSGSVIGIILRELFSVKRRFWNFPVLPMKGVKIVGVTRTKSQSINEEVYKTFEVNQTIFRMLS